MKVKFKNKTYLISSITISDLEISLMTESNTLLYLWIANQDREENKELNLIDEKLKLEGHKFYNKVEKVLLENKSNIDKLCFDLEKELPTLQERIKLMDMGLKDSDGEDVFEYEEHHFNGNYNLTSKTYSYALILKREHLLEENDENKCRIYFFNNNLMEKNFILKNGIVYFSREVISDKGTEDEFSYDEIIPIQLGNLKEAVDIKEFISLLKDKKVHISYMEFEDKVRENEERKASTIYTIIASVVAVIFLSIMIVLDNRLF